MTAIYVLARNGEDYGNYEMVGWFDNRETANAEALKRELADHHKRISRTPSPGITHLSPDETEYRYYWIEELHKL